MSYKKAQWKSVVSGKVASDPVQKFGTSLQKTTQGLKTLLSGVEQVMSVVEKFLQTYMDPIAPFMEKLKTVFEAFTNDLLGLGGGVIFIHPWNRINKRTISFRASQPGLKDYKFDKVHLSKEASNSFYITIPPIDIPAMTPAEAFVELQNSFSNKNDPWRPRWTPLSTTTGFGILLAVSDLDKISPFIKALEAYANFFEFGDFKEALDKYRNQLSTYTKDLDESMYKAAAQNLRGQGIVADVTETAVTMEDGKVVKQLQMTKFKIQTELPSLHWYALSVENIPALRLMVDSITTFMDWIIQVTQSASSAVWELFDIIKKRVFTLIELFENVVNAMSSLFSMFYLGDAYTFVIEPEAGGVEHLMQSIQTSIQSPETTVASDVAKIWTTADLSVLLFAAGGAPNKNAWDLFARTTLPASESEEEVMDFEVSGIVAEALYPKNTAFTLEFVTQNEDLYFTYTVQDSLGKIINQWSDYVTHKLMGNIAITPFTIQEDGKYTLEVIARYDGILDEDLVVKTYNFQVSSLITAPLLPPIKEAPFEVQLADDFSGTVTLQSEGGKIFDKSKTYGGGSVSIGQTLNESGVFELVITDLNGNSIKSKMIIDSRWPLVSMGILQTTIYLPSLPYTVKMSDFAKVVKIFMDGSWTTITLPGYITFNEYACFNAQYYLDGVWRDARVCTSPIDTSFKDIC